MFHTPAQAGARQPHGGARPAAAAHRDVERGAAASHGDGAEAALGKVETQRAQAGGTTEKEANDDQTAPLPSRHDPQPFPCALGGNLQPPCGLATVRRSGPAALFRHQLTQRAAVAIALGRRIESADPLRGDCSLQPFALRGGQCLQISGRQLPQFADGACWQTDHTANFIVGLRGGAYRDRVEQQNLPGITSPAQHESCRRIDAGLYTADDVGLPELTRHHHIFT